MGIPTEQAAQTHSFEAGDRVVWEVESRGGYGFRQNVAGVVTALGRKRVQIRVARKAACGWVIELRWVAATSLSRRSTAVPAVDDLSSE